MNNFEKLKQAMDNPDRKYGVYPIIHHNILDNEQIEKNDEDGFAGVVANIEYRRGFDVDDTVWKETAENIRKYIEKGMHIWLYDEDGYPSGVASGYLTEKYPEHIVKGLYCYEYWRTLTGPQPFRSNIPGDKLWKAVLVSVDGDKVIDITHTLNENDVLYFDIPEGEYYFIMMSIRRLFDGAHPSESWSTPRNYVNLFDEKATERFIEMTHEKYKQFLGDEFGKGILATFTDEPSLVAWCLTGAIKDGIYPWLVWQDDLPEKFYNKYGYDLLDACIAILKDNIKGAIKMRCDYWEFLADAVARGFFKKIQDWCHENNLKSSGHFIGEELLAIHVLGYGSFFRCMKHLDWPGIDMLYTTPEELMNETTIPVGRLVASVADISGENEVFTEYSDLTFKVNKTTAPPEVYYGSTNWHIALGVNNFTSYFSFKDVTTEEKRRFNKYVARCGEVMRWGIRDSKVAVYYPEPDMWSTFVMSAEYAHTNKMGGEKFVQIQTDYCNLTWGLLNRQVDFDYIYNDIILDGEIKDGKLVYKNRSYSKFIISSFNIVDDRIAEKVIELAKNGIEIRVLKGRCEISRTTGEKSAYADEFAKLVADGTIITADTIDKLLDNNFDGGIIRTKNLQKKLMTHCRITEDGTRIAFAANMGRKKLSDTLTVDGEFSGAYIVNPEEGTVNPIKIKSSKGKTKVGLKLDPIKASIILLER